MGEAGAPGPVVARAGADPKVDLDSPYEAVILASIVEKETGLKDERARVAAVFHNRLKKGMALQSDPTVIYAVTLGKAPLGRDLTYADLKLDSPYNTYLHVGLTPTPIANPGLASLQAALNPESHNYYYYVLNPATGAHQFSTTQEEHEQYRAQFAAAAAAASTQSEGE